MRKRKKETEKKKQREREEEREKERICTSLCSLEEGDASLQCAEVHEGLE